MTMIGNMPDEISKIIQDFIRPKLDERFIYTIEWSNDKDIEKKIFYKVENADAYHNKIMKLPRHKKPIWTSYTTENYNEYYKCWITDEENEIFTYYETCDNCNSLCCSIKTASEEDRGIIKCRYCKGDFCDDCLSDKPRRYMEINNCCLNCCENQSEESESESESDSDSDSDSDSLF